MEFIENRKTANYSCKNDNEQYGQRIYSNPWKACWNSQNGNGIGCALPDSYDDYLKNPNLLVSFGLNADGCPMKNCPPFAGNCVCQSSCAERMDLSLNKSLVTSIPNFGEKSQVNALNQTSEGYFRHQPMTRVARASLSKTRSKTRKEKKERPCLSFAGATQDQIKASEICGQLKKGRILPTTVASFVLRLGKSPVFTNDFEKAVWKRGYDENVQRLLSVLSDRLMGAVNKNGCRLVVGAMRGSMFEHYFGTVWGGERKISTRRFGDGSHFEDWNIQLIYKFKKGHPFLLSLKPKTKICEDNTGEKNVMERQEIHFYVNLEFSWNIFNGIVVCKWEQESWKRMNGSWRKIH